jgi:hypothetical protein
MVHPQGIKNKKTLVFFPDLFHFTNDYANLLKISSTFLFIHANVIVFWIFAFLILEAADGFFAMGAGLSGPAVAGGA